MNVKGVFLHQSDNWSTPSDIYEWYINELEYYDPCPLNADFDGLNKRWFGDVFVNPPYSDILSWVKKGIEEKKGHILRNIVFLLPVRTDTEWFKVLCDYGCTIYFLRGRLKFGGSKLGAPFPSMLVYLGGDNDFSVIKRDEFRIELV